MSSVFGTGQSMNSMARIMNTNRMSKVCASSREYPHVEKKIKNLREQNFKGTVAQTTVIIIIIIIIYLLITRKYQYTFSPARLCFC